MRVGCQYYYALFFNTKNVFFGRLFGPAIHDVKVMLKPKASFAYNIKWSQENSLRMLKDLTHFEIT